MQSVAVLFPKEHFLHFPKVSPVFFLELQGLIFCIWLDRRYLSLQSDTYHSSCMCQALSSSSPSDKFFSSCNNRVLSKEAAASLIRVSTEFHNGFSIHFPASASEVRNCDKTSFWSFFGSAKSSFRAWYLTIP